VLPVLARARKSVTQSARRRRAMARIAARARWANRHNGAAAMAS
jgi:hypothetical protein